MKKLIKKLWPLLLIIPLIAVGLFIIWAETPIGPMPEALQALNSNAQVTVDQSHWIVFMPTAEARDTGLIFYPGGRVDPRSYAPVAQAIASKGYPVVIVPMPLNLAVFAPGRAKDVIAAYPEINQWVIAGHSLGGAMAAHFVKDDPEKVNGLALWAAYPAGSDDLSAKPLAVSSIYGTLDGLNDGKIEASKPLLPAGTFWVPINGGNHAQFGWYGNQPGDNPAQIDRELQQEQAVNATLELLRKVEIAGQ